MRRRARPRARLLGPMARCASRSAAAMAPGAARAVGGDDAPPGARARAARGTAQGRAGWRTQGRPRRRPACRWRGGGGGRAKV
eukprot:2253495-Prymnesium_polylepis.2